MFRTNAFPVFSLALAISFGSLVTTAEAGEPRRVPLDVDSGWVENTGPVRDVIFSEIVDAGEAPWVRVDFDRETYLGEPPVEGAETIVRLTSLHDGAEQRLEALHIEQWRYMSAFFNGGEVLVEVVADPGAAPTRLVLDSALAGSMYEPESICDGIDERELSEDPRVARGWSSGGSPNCTAWLFNDSRRCMNSAGHCGFVQVHFNVPISTPSGSPQVSHPDDQYAVDPDSEQSQFTGVGGDWYYFGTFPNPNTGLTPYEAQGDAFTLLSESPPPDNEGIRITGFGTTSSPVPPAFNRAQKTHVGPYVDRTGTTLHYRPDTTGGNSGSPVIYEPTGEVIGVHTHAGCTSSGGANRGTAIEHPNWQSALANPTGVCMEPEEPWELVSESGPDPRNEHAMAFDARRGVTVLHGGVDSGLFGDTWEWNGIDWSLVSTDGPSARSHHAMVFDAARGHSVLFGGWRAGIAGDTWAWDGSEWTELATSGPSPRLSHAMAYDSDREVVVLFGGLGGAYLSDTWEWDGEEWTQVANDGPRARIDHAMAYDEARGVVVLFGGNSGSFRLRDTWEWDGQEWTQVANAGPSSRWGHAMAYDAEREATVLFGGISTQQEGDVWSWDGTTWRHRITDAPSPRYRHAMVYDSRREVPVVFGGRDSSGNLGDTWEWGEGVCLADWNGDGEVDVNDFFAYLEDFEDNDPRADLNGDGEIDINDFFLFLQLFEAGC